MSEVRSMKCPNPECGKVDVTDFSTCRACGHKYDGSMERSVSALAAHMPAVSDSKSIYKWGLVLLLVGAAVFAIRATQSQRFDRLAPIRQSIITSGRPRAIFILKNWAQPYVTTINNEAEKYGTTIDFEKLNSEDPANKALIEMFGIQETPLTAIFDRTGKESKTISGPISQADLEHYLQNAVRQNAPAKKSL
jgi:hypothetical protein